MKRVLVLSLAFFGGVALGADGPTAKGTFKSRDVTMPVTSAVAFRGEALLDKDVKDAVIVVVTNANVNAMTISGFYDRRRVIDKRLKDDETGIVTLEFTKDGKYRGLSYYFASGNGCGYCGGGVDSTVKLTGGRLVGGLKASDESRSFDITLDVPVMSDDHGAALPAGGGEPGKAYLAYHAALAAEDRAALKPVLSEDRQKTWANAEKKKSLDGFVRYLRSEHPTQSVRIVRGWSKGDTAILLVEGESPVMKLRGEVALVRENGVWRVDDELTDVVMN